MGLMETKVKNIYIRIFFFTLVLWKNNKLDKNVLYGNSKIRNKNNKNIGADKKKKSGIWRFEYKDNDYTYDRSYYSINHYHI